MINKLKKEIEKEIEIPIENLLEYSINLPKLQFKYLNILTKEIVRLKKIEIKKQRKFNELLEETLNREINFNKNTIEKIIMSKPEYEKILLEYEKQKEIVEYLKEIVELFKRNSYLLTNIIKLYMFLNGG